MAGEQLRGDLVSLETITVASAQAYANITKDALTHYSHTARQKWWFRIIFSRYVY